MFKIPKQEYTAEFQFRRRDVADRLQQPTMIEKVDPFQGRVLDGVDMPPRTAMVNDFGLVQADDGLGQRVVVGIPDAAYRRLDAGLRQPLGVANRQMLRAPAAVMDDALRPGSRPQRLRQRVQDQFGVHRARHAPADDAAGEDIDHEGRVDEAGPGRRIGEVGHPQLIRPAGLELPVDAIQRPGPRCRRRSWSGTCGRGPPRAAPAPASAARPCSEPPPGPPGPIAAAPCGRRRPGSSPRRPGESPPPTPDPVAAATAAAPGPPPASRARSTATGRSATARRSTRTRRQSGGRR